MRKKALCAVLSVAMMASMFTACGSDDKSSTSTSTSTSTSASTSTSTSASSDASSSTTPDSSANTPDNTEQQASGGKVLNIYVWNNEFANRLQDHYPGYEANDKDDSIKGGKIGDVTVVFHQTDNQNNAYQNALDDKLLAQKDAAADDKIDIFLVEADYANKYIDSDYAASLASVGISLSDLSSQYTYTQDAVTDAKGVLKGASWQACPGVMFYNAAAAKEVFGTDDPAEIQNYVKDWDTFGGDTAKKLKDAGYYVVQSVMDTYRVYSNNATTPWLVDGKVNLDANIKKWADDSMKLVEAGYATTYSMWGEDWKKGFMPEGKVFSYFGPAWFINFSMSQDTEGSIANTGGWRATEGPQSFFWGGTWICVADGTDNAAEIKDIILKLTTDADVMKGIVDKDQDFVNNQALMESIAPDYAGFATLGGQNPLPMFVASAKNIKLNTTYIDQTCTEQFQNCMKEYFDGNLSYDAAIELFKKNVTERHPECTEFNF